MPRTQDVRVGAPDQKVTGAIKHAPLGTTLPTLSSITKADLLRPCPLRTLRIGAGQLSERSWNPLMGLLHGL